MSFFNQVAKEKKKSNSFQSHARNFAFIEKRKLIKLKWCSLLTCMTNFFLKNNFFVQFVQPKLL